MKKNILFLICLFFLHLSCKRSNQEIKLDDYEIIKIAIKEEVTPSISQFENDKNFLELKKSTDEYKKVILENYSSHNYGSQYYFTTDNLLFTFKTNSFIEDTFLQFGFYSNLNKVTPVKIDLKKIIAIKNLILINDSSNLKKHNNYIGDFRFSRVLYDGNKAIILVFNTTNNSRNILFFKKNNEKWVLFLKRGIPIRYKNQEVVF